MNNIAEIYKIFKECKSICTDSRRIIKNSLFFALKGNNFDGNKFAEKAVNLGCAYAIVDNPNYILSEKYILVKDVLKTLQELAKYHRKQLNIPIIAITGTNGKTTTKELISSVLAQKYRLIATKGNMNNHIGVPLTLLSMNHTTDFGVIEMGASGKGEIKLLCEITQPNYGLITNIGRAHLQSFGSEEIIAQTKKELYDYLIQNEGTIFINDENKKLKKMLGDYQAVKYGNTEDSICKGKIVTKELYVGVEWEYMNNKGIAYSNLIGNYNFENILASICIGSHFCISSVIIDKTIGAYIPSNNRSQWIMGRRNQLVLDFYNANPTSMEIAINNFIQYQANKKILILGDMLELGTHSNEEHNNILKMIDYFHYEDVFLVGNEFFNLRKGHPYIFFEDVNQLNQYLVKNPPSGSLILVKGSRGIKLEKCIDYL